LVLPHVSFLLLYLLLLLFLCFFFFQAEDGIRDRNVTGVQTCALPISLWSFGFAPLSLRERGRGRGFTLAGSFRSGRTLFLIPFRSEERRVGKECRSRWAP